MNIDRRKFITRTLTASVALTSKVNAGPQSHQAENSYFDRASKVTDGGGL